MNWETPELIVLTRNQGAENVLFCCKTQAGCEGPMSNQGSCVQLHRDDWGYCGACKAEVTS